jgi:integrase/recombinase XerD
MNIGGGQMNPYTVEKIQDGSVIYFFIRCMEDMSIMPLPTKYLTHMTKARKSPNTVKRIAFSISYYMSYLEDRGVMLGDVSELAYSEQHTHFTEFLYWLKNGNHNGERERKQPSNSTCNTYLRDVFGWFTFLELEYEQFHDLKVLSSRVVSFSNNVGVRFSVTCRTFKGYFKEDEHIGRTIEKDSIITLLEACVNCRDQLMLLLLSETGFRIGEILGIRYTQDIDYNKRIIRVMYREDNDNFARAKNAEYRRAKISQDTFDILMYYLAENRELLKDGDYLFINLTGENIGEPENVNTVYAMLNRLEDKTGIKATPHMLRHYFANERRKNGWDLPLISKALGHKHISTTESYLNIDADELSQATDEYYSRNKALFMVDKLI